MQAGQGASPPQVYAMRGGGQLPVEQVLQGWRKKISLAFCQMCDTCGGGGRGGCNPSLTSLFWTIFLKNNFLKIDSFFGG
jgi:hypothetical protein